jgi:hypothetical protein
MVLRGVIHHRYSLVALWKTTTPPGFRGDTGGAVAAGRSRAGDIAVASAIRADHNADPGAEEHPTVLEDGTRKQRQKTGAREPTLGAFALAQRTVSW